MAIKSVGFLVIISICILILSGCASCPNCPSTQCPEQECPVCEKCPTPEDLDDGYITYSQANEIINYTNNLIDQVNICYPDAERPLNHIALLNEVTK